MSLLIKALRQAERDHLAHVAAAAPPVATPEPEPALQLQLEPRESSQASRAPSSYLPTAGTDLHSRAIDAAAAATEPAPAPESIAYAVAPALAVPALGQEPSAQDDAGLPPLSTVALEAGASAHAPTGLPASHALPLRPAPDITLAGPSIPTPAPAPPSAELAPSSTPTAVAAASSAAAALARAAAATRARAEPTTRPTASTSDAATPAPAAVADAAAARGAARYLIAPDPDAQRLRRLRLMLASIAILVLGGGLLAAWLGIMPDMNSTWRNTTAMAGRLGNTALLNPVAPADAGTPAAGPGVALVAPEAGKGTARASTTAANHAPDAHPGTALASSGAPRPSAHAPSGSPASTADTGSTAAAPLAGQNPAPAAIHLRGPEVSAEHVRALLQEAYQQSAHGDPAAARSQYERVLEIDRNNGDAWIGLATLAANAGDTAAATRYYHHALDIDPTDSIALAGVLGLQANVDPQEYEARLRQLLVRDGGQAALQSALGRLMARQGRWLEAQEAYYQAWNADPAQADAAFNLAVSLERIRQPEAALNYYRRALALAASHPAHFNVASASARVAALAPVPTADPAAATGAAPSESTGAGAPAPAAPAAATPVTLQNR